MSERGTSTRKQEHEIVIDASADAVWKAITDAEELTRWFVEAARVEPGVGGKFWISWGGAEGSPSTIEAWEPNRLLRVALAPFDMGPAKHDGMKPIIDEYTIERRDGKTVLRLVSSGIPDVKEWDGFYDGTDAGWPSFFRTLRHYLENHAGKPRASIKVVGKLDCALEEGWARLTGPAGFGFEPVAGEVFSTRTSAGEALHGRVVFVKAPGLLELSIREFDNAFFAHSMACSGGGQYVYSVLSVYGKSAAEVDAIRARWEPWLTSVLGLQPAAFAG
jgi:uncharacterized protein YndB with AHSA1/START domain